LRFTLGVPLGTFVKIPEGIAVYLLSSEIYTLWRKLSKILFRDKSISFLLVFRGFESRLAYFEVT